MSEILPTTVSETSDKSVEPQIPRTALVRGCYVAVGVACLVLGVIGILLPLLPTTPFVLLAGFFFARSSPRLYSWLLQHRLFGKMVGDWQERGAIRLRAKWLATLMLLAVMGLSLLLAAPAAWVWALCGGCAAGILGFLWTRPTA